MLTEVRGLRCCVNQLEKLDPEIVPAVLGCRLSNHASTEHLRMLKQEWQANVDLLIDGVDEVMDLKNFLHISGRIYATLYKSQVQSIHFYTSLKYILFNFVQMSGTVYSTLYKSQVHPIQLCTNVRYSLFNFIQISCTVYSNL